MPNVLFYLIIYLGVLEIVYKIYFYSFITNYNNIKICDWLPSKTYTRHFALRIVLINLKYFQLFIKYKMLFLYLKTKQRVCFVISINLNQLQLENKMPYLKLQSSDGEIFSVETQIAKQSNTIRTMLEGKHPVYFFSH